MTYNLTGVAASESPLQLAQAVNVDIMQGMFGTMLLLALVAVIFMAYYFSTRDLRQTVMGTSWITFVLAVFLRAMSLVPNLTLFITLIMAALAIGFFWASDR